LDLCEDLRLTLIFVTHAIDEAIVVGTRVIALSARPGRIVDDVVVGPRGAVPRGSPSFGRLESRLEARLAPEVTR
ncbi:MAG: mannosyltransferase, partial [Rhodospirillales bacterium]|nr:mannosyltransferase [Rhodospirillales bacterium]